MSRPPSRYRTMMRKAETDIIEYALEAAGHHVGDAAELLQIDKSRLYKRMRALDIPTPQQQQRRDSEPDSEPEPPTAPEPEPDIDPPVDTVDTPDGESVDQSSIKTENGVDESAN